MKTPLLATYRLQLRDGTTFSTARRLASYWQRLGVSHLYLSPILAARTGSAHGYDVTDPARVDPSLGGERGLRALAGALWRAGLGILLDVVPNHVAADPGNPYFDDVLRRGRASRWAAWFDVDWGEGRLVLPFLGERLPRALARGDLRLVVEQGELRVRYFERSFPLDPATLSGVGLASKPSAGELDRFSRGPEGRRRLSRLLGRQSYRLCEWRRGGRVLNYRRFFEIDELIALRVEDPRVFDATHAKTLDLLARGLVHGLRVDHVDGLADPRAYLERLRAAVRRPGGARTPILVEKILAASERLRDDWPVEGTTGYEFLNQLEAVFLDARGAARVEEDWRRVTRRRASFEETARAGKRLVLSRGLAADVRRLARAIAREPSPPRPSRRPPVRALRRALIETIAALPVYRTYADARGRMPAHERRWLARALAEARRARVSPAALRRLEALLLGGGPGARGHAEILRRFQQLSGPAAAKGVEDTALYVHAPLASRNEVGGEPDTPLEPAVDVFHAAAGERRRRWPHMLLSATTHDTKRNADVRSRLDVLSELPDAWADAVRRWRRANRAHRRGVRGRRLPDPTTELLLYQTLVGIWPLPRADRPGPPPAREIAAIEQRVQRYMQKAVREAKVHTSWRRPDAGFEAALEGFVRALLSPRPSGRAFVRALDAFVRETARPGLWNALSRQLVQLTAPGVPDLYQGDELWSFSLVDPDNRRPVDFARRRRLLRDVERRFEGGADARRRFVREIVGSPEDGRIKLHAIRCALHARRRHAALFAIGDYAPLRARGPHARHVVAFARRRGRSLALVVVPRLARTRVGNPNDPPCGARVWDGTLLPLPPRAPAGILHSPLTGERIALARGTRAVPLARLLASFPVGLWLWEPRTRRG